jgi:hypothetical protein
LICGLRHRAFFAYAAGMVLPPAPDLLQLEAGIAASLENAGRMLLCMPSAGAVPLGLRKAMPRGFIEAAIEAHGLIASRDRPAAPSQRAVAAMAEAYAWILLVDDVRVQRVLLLRSIVHPVTARPFFGARKLARLFAVHPDTVAAWHRRGIHAIAEELHRRAAAAEPAERARAA